MTTWTQEEIDGDQYDTPLDDGSVWRFCWNCEDGLSGHDCGEDCCMCVYPEDNMTCDICDGKGGWVVT